MKYHSASSFRAAIDARLKRYAAEHGQAALARQRKRIVFDRFLARLIQAAPGEWTLKGGVALDYRLGEKARATRDLDLLHNPDVDALGNELADAESMDLGDFFQFSIQRTDKLDSLTDGSAIRYHVLADLDSRQFERFIVDVGFDDAVNISADVMWRPGFLEFAAIESPSLPVLPIEVHLAEKVHAYARIYSGGNSSRVKDLIDMVLIGTTQSLSADSCRLALKHTFTSRGAHAVPSRLEVPPTAWTIPYRTLAASVALDPDIANGHAFAASMLDPLLSGDIGNAAVWSPGTARWASG